MESRKKVRLRLRLLIYKLISLFLFFILGCVRVGQKMTYEERLRIGKGGFFSISPTLLDL